MIRGIGIDLVEIERFAKMKPRLLRAGIYPAGAGMPEKPGGGAERGAGKFAAKEAVLALGLASARRR